MKRRKSTLATSLALAMLVNGAVVFAATPTAKAADLTIDPYTIDWVVKYEENFDEPVTEPETWVRDTYEEQKDEFWGDYGYAERYHYADDHNGADIKTQLDQFGAYRKSYSFGQDNWLTIEAYARNEGDDPDVAPTKGGHFIINGDGKAVMVVEKHTDAAIIGSTDPLPSTYRLEVTVKNIDVGGLNLDENGKDVAMNGSSWDPWTREEANPYVDYTGKRANGYFTEDDYLDAGPWVGGDAKTQNGMYFLGIVDYGNPRPQNNTFIHYHRKLAFDTDNNGPKPWSEVYDSDGNKLTDGSRYISMLWLDAYKQNAYTSGCKFFSYTSKDGGTPEEGATMVDKYKPGKEYTFAVVRTPESYTMEVTGDFYYAGQHTYSYTKPHIVDDAPGSLSGWTYHFNQTLEELQGLIPPTADDKYDYGDDNVRVDWPADATYPDYFYIGIPHINFYSGTAEFTNITLKVPVGSADDPAMNVKETVRVTGVTAEDKTYDGKAPVYNAEGLSITALGDDTDLTEMLSEHMTYTWYTAANQSKALSIAPKDAGSYILKAGVEILIDGELYRGEQAIPVTISKATVTVTADDQAVDVNGEQPTYTYTATGLAEGDTFVLEPTVTCPSADLTRNGTFTIQVKGATLPLRLAGNYNDIIYKTGSLKVGTGSSGGGGGSSSSGGAKASDGSTTRTVKNRDGSSTTTVTYPTGTSVVAETTAAGETTATVTLGKNVTAATVTVPVKNATAGTVAVLVKDNGEEEIVRKSVLTENSMLVLLTENAKLKFVNRSQSFDDVQTGHWALSAVNYVSSRQLFQGTGNNQFSPEATMTRGMLLTVLARLDGADTTPAAGEAWFAKGAAWAEANAVSNGQNPDENITRQELAILLWRYAGKPETKGSISDFTDSGAVDSFAEIPMRWAVEKGIINGKDGKILDPQGTASRAEVAAMLERFVKAAI